MQFLLSMSPKAILLTLALGLLSFPGHVLSDISLLGLPGEYFQLTDRWTGQQLNSASDLELVEHSSLSSADISSHWTAESIGVNSWFRLKNRKSGGYLHIQADNGNAYIGDVPDGYWSSHWRAVAVGGYFRLLNRWQRNDVIHVQQQTGYLQHGSVPQRYWSAQWSSVTIGVGNTPGNANEIGQWSDVAPWPLTAIHAALTAGGKVLTYGTTASGVQSGQFIYDVWDPKLGVGPDAHATLPNQTGTDLFCSAQVLIPNTDEMLITGGDTRGLNTGIISNGVNDVNIFTGGTNSIQPQTGMNFARWYPTLTTLSNGEILVQGGIDTYGQAVSTPEIYNPDSREWRVLTGATSEFLFSNNGWWYPRSWVAPNGKIFGLTNASIYEIDTAGQGAVQTIGTITGTNKNYTSTSVMYRPGRILQIGGGLNQATNAAENASAQVTEYNINGPRPQVTERPEMTYPRHWANTTVLPDGKVLVTGGSAAANTLKGVATAAEIYDPTTNSWTVGATAVEDRLYHSTALLLPDASVLIAGGGAPGPNDRAGNQVPGNLNAEIYYPPYFFDENNNKRDLDTVETNNNQITWSQIFRVLPRLANRVAQVNLVRVGSVTHSNNMEQRFIPLSFDQTEANELSVVAPSSANVAPPGSYMLFVVDVDGVPSQGLTLSLGNPSTQTNDGPYFQVSDRWFNQELFTEHNLTEVQYGEIPMEQQSSHWSKEYLPGQTLWFRIKNRGSSDVLHIQPNNGVVAIGDVPDDYWSSQWREETYQGFVRLVNRWQSNHRINVQVQNGRAQHGIVPNDYWSAQWKLNPVY